MPLPEWLIPLLGALGVGALLKTFADAFLNRHSRNQSYYHKEWEYLKKEVEDLRQEVAELREEVVELRSENQLLNVVKKTLLDVYAILQSDSEKAVRTAIELIEVVIPVITYDRD